ncbi:MAG: four helix bundle protein [Saprospiraceae bacterium]|nr:four helix bundle protein [Saprospiraceae bacterium]
MNIVLEKSFNFALKIIEFCLMLENERRFVLNNQLLKSGTSIGANIREAQNPHSKADFISKMVIAMKEADETEYWLLLCQKSPSLPNPDGLLEDIAEIKRIIGKIILSSKSAGPKLQKN